MAVNQNVPDLNPQSDNCKLDIDCFELLADWLSLVDLHSIGQTCKRFQQYAGYVFRQTYPGAYVEYKNGGILIGDIPVNGFCDFIENLSIQEDELECFNFIKSYHFKSLKRIEFHGVTFTDEKIACIKHILKKGATEESAVVDDIQLFECTLDDGEFYEKFLKHCVNMKRLSLKVYRVIGGIEPFIGIDNSWMHREYSKLEYFALYGDLYVREMDVLITLCHQNPNIRKLAIDPAFGPHDRIAELGLVVDDLAIMCYDSNSEFLIYEAFVGPKFFKRVQLYGSIFFLPNDYSLPIDKIETIMILDQCKLSQLANLKTLCIKKKYLCLDKCRTLTQLERVSIDKATLPEMEAFICYLPMMHTITIKEIENEIKEIGRDIWKWNRERRRLARACKVTVYVQESVYLAVKLAAYETNYKFLELKRFESYEWDHDFGYPECYQ